MKLRPTLFILLMWSGPALAASRLVVTMRDPGMIYVDDQLIQTGPGVQKAVVNYITPGVHRILIRQTDGILLYQGTVSIGVAAWCPGVESWEALVSQADQALYAAKEGGRNRVCLWDGNARGVPA